MQKLIIFSAPSGAGKSTIINYLLKQNLGLEFSISATSRLPRGREVDGVEYYFLSPEEFRQKIDNDEFVEHEEVYKNTYYGTLRSEVDRITSEGKTVIFDVDVLGGVNLKKIFGSKALAVFIVPPSIDALRDRLKKRQTDSDEMIEKRVGKAEYELGFSPQYDIIVVNDKLELAKQEALKAVKEFLAK